MTKIERRKSVFKRNVICGFRHGKTNFATKLLLYKEGKRHSFSEKMINFA